MATILVAALALGVAACGDASGGGEAAVQAGPDGVDDGSELTLWTRAPLEKQAKLLVEAYNASHKNQVKLTVVPNDDYVAKVGAAAGSAGRLCYYDADCEPRAGLPAARSELTNGGEAWVAAVGVLKVTDRPQLPGETIAAAAEVGYHAAVVPTACDEGADSALGLTGLGNYYTAVYFASQADAETLAAALPALEVKVIQVRTYCV